ncbi:hypothetical protein [Streptomyces chrestomyceticus]|uniref:hypothetical protein n=1 Tax=Streptomyces chrestomyceticus TaxID=68185 RepID=UPI003405D9C3
MFVVNPPSGRALSSNVAVLVEALQQYAEAHPGGHGGAMLELRYENDMLAIRICMDESDMSELAERLTNS